MSLVIREMQIKVATRHYYTPIRMIQIKQSADSTKCQWGCREPGIPMHG